MVLQSKYSNFIINIIDQNILQVECCRPQQMNSMTNDFFNEISQIFQEINNLEYIRVVIITSQGKHFSCGLDLNEALQIFKSEGKLFFKQENQKQEMARASIKLYNLIQRWQQSFTNIQNCRVPVIVGIQGACIGGAIDLISSCDFRICTENAKFSVKEIDIGLAADLGTFPRINNIVGNEGWIREIAYTGRQFDSLEAKQQNFILNIYKDQDEMFKNLLIYAQHISKKSPVAIYGLKKILNQQKKFQTDQLLDYVATMNMSLLNTQDILQSVQGQISKQIPKFGKL